MRPFIQNIQLYITANLPTVIVNAVFSTIGLLAIWLISFVWNTNTERLTDIAKATQATASSMQELVIFVKEDRVKIINLERRMNNMESWKEKSDADVQDFWKNYYYNPMKKIPDGKN